MITGMPGTGKTTSAFKLKEHFDAEVYDADILRRSLGATDYDREDTPKLIGMIWNGVLADIRIKKTAILAMPCLSRRERARGYGHFKKLSKEMRLKINVLLINCEASEEIAKQRISVRPDKDHLHRPINDPGYYDRVRIYNQPIEEAEIGKNEMVSFVIQNTDSNTTKRLCVRPPHEEAVTLVERLLSKQD